MKKSFISLFFLAVAFAVVPLMGAAQTADTDEQAALAQIAEQLKGIEQEVNYLALLVQKIALERQAEDLQRQLAIAISSQNAIVAEVPLPPTSKAVAVEEEQTKPPEDVFAKIDTKDEPFDSAQGKEESVFAAALGSIKNMGTPQLAALTVLGILAVFVLVRRLRGRKQESKGNTRVSPPVGGPSSQTLSQPQQDLLQEGRQELKENVVWK